MMLKIKRVPTLLSNYQQDDDEEGSGCGRNCLGNCCIRGMKLPLYTFKAIDKMIHEKDVVEDEKRGSSVAFLDSLLIGEWEDRMQRGLFRYDASGDRTYELQHRVFQFLLHGDMGSTQIPSANICAEYESSSKATFDVSSHGSGSGGPTRNPKAKPGISRFLTVLVGSQSDDMSFKTSFKSDSLSLKSVLITTKLQSILSDKEVVGVERHEKDK
ncbi:hypothetical protein NE237_012520 [Protea cynaroides]|uniref:Uncharacterized protein n=1 Tax=Protea cynaroides TaxID=273540 RepID=A0A9Q0H177_9MAGN|nr:hypothetical protein NE237_012520 [Protea cynaroides]